MLLFRANVKRYEWNTHSTWVYHYHNFQHRQHHNQVCKVSSVYVSALAGGISWFGFGIQCATVTVPVATAFAEYAIIFMWKSHACSELSLAGEEEEARQRKEVVRLCSLCNSSQKRRSIHTCVNRNCYSSRFARAIDRLLCRYIPGWSLQFAILIHFYDLAYM